jgi:hypothetical protein
MAKVGRVESRVIGLTDKTDKRKLKSRYILATALLILL